MRAARWALWLAAAAGCATSGGGARRGDARLVVGSNVADARVYVDDVFVGRAAELRGHAVLVQSGTRRLELRADGWFRGIALQAGPHRVEFSYRPVSFYAGAAVSLAALVLLITLVLRSRPL